MLGGGSMEIRYRGAFAPSRKIAAALLCGAGLCSAAFLSAPALANPSYTFKTIAVTDANAAKGAFASLGIASINDGGQVAFYAQTFCTGAAVCSGVFTIDAAGTMAKLADGGDPGVGYPYQLFGDAIINHGGAVSFSASNVTSGSTGSSIWLNLWKKGTVRQVVPARAIGPSIVTPYVNPRLLDNSKILYAAADVHALMTAVKGKPPQPAAPGYCTASNATGSSLNGWVVSAGGPTGATCASTGYLATRISTATTTLRVANDGTYGALGAATINASGTIAFAAKNQPGRANVEALYQQKVGGGVIKLAEIDNGTCANAPPASGSCQYRGYANALAISAKGVILTNVLISNWTSGVPTASNTTGLALNGDAQNSQVVWPGMVINGCTVHDVTTGPRAINKYGQIVMLLNCTPSFGSRPNLALVVATPPAQ